MGYLHIDNLYKNIEIMLFKECYAMEKIHGTSAHISYMDGEIKYFAGGGKHKAFVSLFNESFLKEKFKELFDCNVIVYGESYGGKMQGMSNTYGKEPKFIAFDVKVGDCWLDVASAEEIVKELKLEFVDYVKIPTDLKFIDIERDKPSTQAKRNGIEEDRAREGVVLRPLKELIRNDGKRIIVKHKGDNFKETKTKREINPEKLKMLEDVEKIAIEWVTPMRLNHVLDKMGNPKEMSEVRNVIKSMIEDVYREAKNEIVESKFTEKAIGKKTVELYKNKISKLNE